MTAPTKATKAAKEATKREGVLAEHIRARKPGPFDAASLARSFALPVARVAQIITRNGG